MTLLIPTVDETCFSRAVSFNWACEIYHSIQKMPVKSNSPSLCQDSSSVYVPEQKTIHTFSTRFHLDTISNNVWVAVVQNESLAVRLNALENRELIARR